MALIRRRRPEPTTPAAPRAQAVLVHYALGVRKTDLDRFVQVQQLLGARAARRAGGTLELSQPTDGHGTALLSGPDCHALWAAAERAVALCPLTARAVELRPGPEGTPVVRVPVPEHEPLPLRARLELTTSGGEVVRRRLGAFDLLVRLEAAQEDDWLVLTDLEDPDDSLGCRHLGGDGWVVERFAGRDGQEQVPDADDVLAAMTGWAVSPS